ncbi:MAG: hypothetical protein LAO06_07890 [Acidobacteriia bacterium]|nr:hypothetical protein [Terriglobia bacterium]
MMKFAVVALMSLTLAVPTFAKLHKDPYPVPCSQLWTAVMDTLKNSGHYVVMASDNTEMTATYNITGAVTQRTNSVLLKSQGTGCEMQTQSSFSSLHHNDAGDFKTRVEESLAKLKGAKPSEPAKSPDPTK